MTSKYSKKHHRIKETPFLGCDCIDCIMSLPWPPAVPPEQQQQHNNSAIASAAPVTRIPEGILGSTENATNETVAMLLNKQSNGDSDAEGNEIFTRLYQSCVEMKAESSWASAFETLLTYTAGQHFTPRDKTISYQENNPDEVCRYFNTGIDCTYWLSHCQRAHICTNCQSTAHGAHECTFNPGTRIQGNYTSSANTTPMGHQHPLTPAQMGMYTIPPPDAPLSTNTVPQVLTAEELAMYPIPPPRAPFSDPRTGMPMYYVAAPWAICSNCHSSSHMLPACTNYPKFVCEQFNAEYGCLLSHCQRRHVCSNCHSSAHGVMLCSNFPKFVCEKFNGTAGCLWAGCKRKHVCEKCGGEGHGQAVCRVVGV
ncbi:hypothetical protein PMIN06_000088 [Paraphaeosphaeria minitans]